MAQSAGNISKHMPMMQLLGNTSSNDRDSMKRVDDRTRALLADMDRVEVLAEPVAQLTAAIDKLALHTIGNAARVLLSLEPTLLKMRSHQVEMQEHQAEKMGDRVLSAGEVLKAELQNMHKQIEDVKARSSNLTVRSLCDSVLLTCKRMFNVTEEMHWAVMELQADADLSNGRVKKFGSAAELLQNLKRAAN